MVLQIGMGTDIRGRDYTKAAVRALRDALWHNSLSVAGALGQPTDAMHVEVTIGVPRPELVDKAAVLAVQDAIHHSALSVIRSLGIDSLTMQVEVTIGVQHPERVAAETVKAALPHGEVAVKVVKGGLDVPDDSGGDAAIIASAAVTVRLDLP